MHPKAFRESGEKPMVSAVDSIRHGCRDADIRATELLPAHRGQRELP